ncbi:MAG: phospholipase D-like domain-containing protein, partial [Burkholderiaceae bacterium]
MTAASPMTAADGRAAGRTIGRRACLVATGTWLVGCSTLPTFVPDLSRRDLPPVRLASARGMLSPAQSRAVLNKLKSRGTPTDIFDRHLALEEAISGSPLTIGNRVQLLQDGPATYRAMLKAIDGARDHVNMETYILEDDAIGQQFADMLIRKQSEGVQVNLIYDSVGTLQTPKAFFDRLRDGGVHLVEFNPVNPLNAKRGWELNQRDHRKLLIVDGATAFLGGINISGVYSSGSSVTHHSA